MNDVPGEPQHLEVAVAVVCTANQARSPLAAALLRRHVVGLPVHLRSRGLLPVGSAPAHPEMVRAAQELGIDLGAHRACALARGELEDADLVIGFEPSHTAAAVVDGGARRGRCFTLLELADLLDVDRAEPMPELRAHVAATLARADERRGGRDPFRAASIDDPAGSGRATFERVAREIEEAVERLATGLFPGSTRTARPLREQRSRWRRVLPSTARGAGGSSNRPSA